MVLSNPNTAYSDEDLMAEIVLRVETQIPSLNSYGDARNALIRSEENATLWSAYLRGIAPQTTDDDGITTFFDRITEGSMDGNPTLGYGFNLNDNIAAEDAAAGQ